ncbi:MAG: prepilin-type N-terminal cleavage/methylation domain-containing protein, partial [Patescibacteria group bacterium]
MMHQFLVSSLQFLAELRDFVFVLKTQNSKLKTTAGFTLVETLVAVMLLSVAVVAPMSLAARSLGSAYYARDQITAFYLAQEAIEALRSIRDSQILLIAGSSSGAPPDIFGLIPHQNEPFMV